MLLTYLLVKASLCSSSLSLLFFRGPRSMDHTTADHCITVAGLLKPDVKIDKLSYHNWPLKKGYKGLEF
jgi:hypothetical protein